MRHRVSSSVTTNLQKARSKRKRTYSPIDSVYRGDSRS